MALEVLDRNLYLCHEFYKGVAQLGADRSLRILYIRLTFVWKRRLVSRVFHFKLFNTSADLTSCEEPVIT